MSVVDLPAVSLAPLAITFHYVEIAVLACRFEVCCCPATANDTRGFHAGTEQSDL